MTRRRWWIVVAVAAAAGGVAAALSVSSAVRSAAVAEAAERGFSVEIDDVSLGWGAIWLSGVSVVSDRVAGVTGELDHVEVPWGMSGVTGVHVHGGTVRIAATQKELVDTFAKRGTGSGSGASSGRALKARGLHVVWTPSEQERYRLAGVGVSREQGVRRLSADRVSVKHRLGTIEATGLVALLADQGLQLRELSVRSTDAALDLEGLVEALPPTSAGGAATKRDDDAGQGGGPNAGDPGLQGRARHGAERKASPLAGLLQLAPGRGERLHARLSQLVGVVARRLPEASKLELNGVSLHLRRGASGGLRLGPARLRVSRDAEALSVHFEPGFEAGSKQHLEASAVLPLTPGKVKLRISGGPIPLSRLGIRDGDLGLVSVDGAELRVEADLTTSEDGSRAVLDMTGKLGNLTLRHAAFARDRLTFASVKWNTNGSFAMDASRIDVDAGELDVGAVKVNVEVHVQRDRDRLSLSGRLEVPLASCQEMFDSLPSGLVPLLSGVRLGGTFSWKTSLVFDTDRLRDMKPDWRMQNDCRFESVPSQISPDRFKAQFSREVPNALGESQTITTGPGSGRWTPLPLVSRYLEAAVLVSEDGRFWSHRGFDQRAIESSIRQNVAAGRFMRGASTISMQLAKNLYLTREKTLSRKVQEALLTMLLEQELRKDEILELYFNVVEFGPGIFGIRQASDYYFRSVPGDLSVAQSFFMASVLPSPTTRYFDEEGDLKERWARYVRRLLRIAADRERITKEELQNGLEEAVRFGVPHHRPDDVDVYEWPEDAPDRTDSIPEPSPFFR